MFRELIDFNKEAYCHTSSTDWLTAVRNNSEIKESKIKSYHPMITHHYVPKILQRQNIWLVNIITNVSLIFHLKKKL